MSECIDDIFEGSHEMRVLFRTGKNFSDSLETKGITSTSSEELESLFRKFNFYYLRDCCDKKSEPLNEKGVEDNVIFPIYQELLEHSISYRNGIIPKEVSRFRFKDYNPIVVTTKHPEKYIARGIELSPVEALGIPHEGDILFLAYSVKKVQRFIFSKFHGMKSINNGRYAVIDDNYQMHVCDKELSSFSGTEEKRINGLERMLEKPKVIICSGENLPRVVEYLTDKGIEYTRK